MNTKKFFKIIAKAISNNTYPSRVRSDRIVIDRDDFLNDMCDIFESENPRFALVLRSTAALINACSSG